MNQDRFLDDKGTFVMEQPENYSYLYFPVAGEQGIKSSLTPNLGGDCKLDQNTFLLEPVSAENLHNNRSTRNFWCHLEGEGIWSATGASAEAESLRFTEQQDDSKLTAGLMWQTLRRTSKKYPLEAKITTFVPLGYNTEIMEVEICNVGSAPVEFTPIAAVPIYGRSADNIRDHRHVTSLLHRIHTTKNGVLVKPTLSFDERGHQVNDTIYYVCGIEGDKTAPEKFYPTTEAFIGEGGSYLHPEAVRKNSLGVPEGTSTEGKEAMGGIGFAKKQLQPQESAYYTIFIGAAKQQNEIDEVMVAFDTKEKVNAAFEKTKEYWQEKVNVFFHTGSAEFDNFMHWVSFQPILRRIYGCSFLPHHDYGKGGRGWRDLWQDCLALLIMNPEGVRRMLLDNFGGVRMDGTNATIIGEKPGEFIADRNNITRVWMDHGVWPFYTTKLYIDQTGDIELLGKKVSYFKDRQVERGCAVDEEWNDAYGNQQKDEQGNVYEGSVFEHLLLQNLCAFYEVGEHGHIRLRGADWNDALDMAEKRGESVAFTNAYAGNLRDLAKYLKLYEEKTGCSEVELLEEMQLLLSKDEQSLSDISTKHEILENYAKACRHNISGRTIRVSIEELSGNLSAKADWIMNHIREKEWVTDQDGAGWFNGYYDNNGRQVEGETESGVRMMLTGQVFSIMGGTAKEEQIRAITQSADKYLYEKAVGGYRLNTNFHEVKTDLGRMFGFAYGEKENGAVFSHMTVMYANALYQRGFAKEGYKALQTLADTAMDFDTSKIYPGIPEYFNGEGRGLYHYLTGAASWYMLTVITQVFGVRGEAGNLMIEPKLVKEQMDMEGKASIKLSFRGKQFEVEIVNPEGLEYGDYGITEASQDGTPLDILDGTKVILAQEQIDQWNEEVHKIVVTLGKRK